MTSEAATKVAPRGADATSLASDRADAARSRAFKASFEHGVGTMALPLIGGGAVIGLWALASATFVQSLPSPSETGTPAVCTSSSRSRSAVSSTKAS